MVPGSGLDLDAGFGFDSVKLSRRCVEDAIEICSIRAPTGCEEERARWLLGRLGEFGSPSLDSAGNVLLRLGGPGPAVAVAAHLDTVFDADTDSSVTRDGDTLRAPGIGDNSLGVAGLVALASLFAGFTSSQRALLLAGTVGEEGLGNLRGARELVNSGDCAEFIGLEGAMLDQLTTGGIGALRVAVTVTGPGGHSWENRGSASAVHELVSLIGETVAGAGTASVNVSGLQSVGAVNAIAPCARAIVEFRDGAAEPLERAEQRLAARAAAVVAPLEVTLETVGRRPGGQTPASHDLVRDAIAARAAAGLPPVGLSASSTDANAAMARGIPAITVGLARGGGEHTLEEWVDVSALPLGLEAVFRLVAGRLGARFDPQRPHDSAET